MRREFSEHFSRRLGARTHPRGGSLPSQVRDLIPLGKKQTDRPCNFPSSYTWVRNSVSEKLVFLVEFTWAGENDTLQNSSVYE